MGAFIGVLRAWAIIRGGPGYVDASFGVAALEVRGVSLGAGDGHAHGSGNPHYWLDPKNAEAYLWLGVSLRKENKDAEARQALAKALELNPNRVWVKQQLDKTPAK